MRHTEKTVKYNDLCGFKIGRGGRFYNQGHVSFYDEMTFAELVKMKSDDLFLKDRDERGRFCKPYLTDCSGHVVSEDNVNGNTGRLDFDGDYETYYVKDIENLDYRERNAIREASGYKSDELIAYLRSYNDEDGICEEEDDEE